MDDNKFDKKIKEKVEAYRDSQFDEHALAGLHERMAGVTYQLWYAPYRKAAGYAAAAVLISLLNFGLFSYFQDSRDQQLLASIGELKQNLGDYEMLKKEFETLKSAKSQIKTDTVYIYKEYAGRSGMVGNNLVVRNIPHVQNVAYSIPVNSNIATAGEDVRLGKVDDLSNEIKNFLAQYELAYIGEDENIYLRYQHLDDARFVKRKGYDEPWGLNNSEITLASVDVDEQEGKALNKHKKQPLSVKVLRDIEKQRMKGVGFQYGPEIDLLNLFSNHGSGDPGVAAGVMAEFILSPSLRVEAGAKYSNTSYSVKKPDQLGSELNIYPGINSDLGKLQQINQRTQAISFPVHLKYYYPVARERYVFASVGVAPQMHIRQQFEYKYAYQYIPSEDDFTVDIEASKHFDDGTFYTGTMDFSLGIEKKLKNSSILQLSAFYNRGIGDLGVEGSQLAMIGLRSALKFRVN